MVSDKSSSDPIYLDARGLLCPLPVIRLQEFAKSVSQVTSVTVIATDPGVLADIPTWCRVNGHEHVSSEEHDDEFYVSVKTIPQTRQEPKSS